MIAVILAGGSGTRFWPLSRQARPKQLIELFGDMSMIGHTVARVDGLAPPGGILVVCGHALLEPTRAALRAGGFDDVELIGEPVARNTAPAIGLAAVVALSQYPDEVVAVFPSDHHVADEAGFREHLVEAEAAARAGYIVTLGIRPTRPETGYGYIRFHEDAAVSDSAFAVEAFVEKPDLDTATEYFAGGRHLWNAGIFVFEPRTLLDEFQRQLPDTHERLRRVGDAWGTDDFSAVLAEEFPQMQKVSIDYGIMEGAARVAVVPADVGWSDVGHWAAIDAVRQADALGNVVEGNAILHDVERCVVFQAAPHRVAGIVGMRDVIVVDTEDAVLVLPRDRAQDVREIVAALAERGGEFT